MNALLWITLGFSIWVCLALGVIACGKAAARADQEWDELEIERGPAVERVVDGRVERYMNGQWWVATTVYEDPLFDLSLLADDECVTATDPPGGAQVWQLRSTFIAENA